MPAAYPSAKPMQTLGAARAPYPGGAGVTPKGGTYGAPPQAMAPPPPQNPTTMQTYGGQTQQTDQMGRVITTTPGGRDPFTGANLGGGTTMIEGPRPTGGGGGTSSGSGGGDGGGLNKADIMGILNSLKGPTVPREVAPTAPAQIAGPEPAAKSAARSQGFARAKDAAGRIGNQALKALRAQMVERGIEGSGVEGQLTGNILGETARGVADAKFNQERAAEDQAWEGTKLGYQGNLSQRAGDMGFMQNNYNTGVQQRQQDMSQNDRMLGMFPTIMSMLGRARY